ncbi:hypothetical protein BIY24_02525 [Halobacteriovorax marinus]|nr:hypothetical protein [Halobacteriovorax marinus]ATH06852.1 hypothetical protein BIY24_02525 [Halobacteriovorax marinus]
MKIILATVILFSTLTSESHAKLKCNPQKSLEISCSDIKDHKREGFCLKIAKKDKLTESKKVRICQSLPRKMRRK